MRLAALLVCLTAPVFARDPIPADKGTADPKAGAVGSLYNIAQDARLNHRLDVVSGVLADEASALLKAFFKAKRADTPPI